MLSRGKFNIIGYSTGFVVTTGTYNTAVGYRTGLSWQQPGNTSIGYGTGTVAIASNHINL